MRSHIRYHIHARTQARTRARADPVFVLARRTRAVSRVDRTHIEQIIIHRHRWRTRSTGGRSILTFARRVLSRALHLRALPPSPPLVVNRSARARALRSACLVASRRGSRGKNARSRARAPPSGPFARSVIRASVECVFVCRPQRNVVSVRCRVAPGFRSVASRIQHTHTHTRHAPQPRSPRPAPQRVTSPKQSNWWPVDHQIFEQNREQPANTNRDRETDYYLSRIVRLV